MHTQNFFGAWLADAQHRVGQLTIEVATLHRNPVLRAAKIEELYAATNELTMLEEMVDSLR